MNLEGDAVESHIDEETMRRLFATAAKHMERLYGEDVQFAYRQFRELAKGSAPMDAKELEHVATFN